MVGDPWMQHLKKHSFSGKTERERNINLYHFSTSFQSKPLFTVTMWDLVVFWGSPCIYFTLTYQQGAAVRSLTRYVSISVFFVCLSNPMLVLKKDFWKSEPRAVDKWKSERCGDIVSFFSLRRKRRVGKQKVPVKGWGPYISFEKPPPPHLWVTHRQKVQKTLWKVTPYVKHLSQKIPTLRLAGVSL